jgi:hypothetical protein
LQPNLKRKEKNMKKILVFMLFALVATQMFSQNNDTYVGSAYYRPIVGGLYQKGSIRGAVFYIDEARNVMKLLCIDRYEIMGEDAWTYTNLSRNLKKYGWKLLNRHVCEEFVSNMSTIEKNETLYKNQHYSFLRSCNIAMESDPNGKYVNIFNPYYSDRRYETTWRYINRIHENGTKTVEELGGFCVTGWREVPLEPQYVTHFSR